MSLMCLVSCFWQYLILPRQKPSLHRRRSTWRRGQAWCGRQTTALGQVQQCRFLPLWQELPSHVYCIFKGQICVAPDYVLCSSKVEERLVPLLAKNLVACNHFQLKFVFVFRHLTLECQMFWFTFRWSGILRIPWPAQIIAKSVSYAKKNNSSITLLLPFWYTSSWRLALPTKKVFLTLFFQWVLVTSTDCSVFSLLQKVVFRICLSIWFSFIGFRFICCKMLRNFIQMSNIAWPVCNLDKRSW